MFHGFVSNWHPCQWELFFYPAISLRPCRRSHIHKLVATHLNRTAYRREKQASICINTHVASIYRQRMFLGQTMSTPCPLCLYIRLLRGICLLASSSSGLVWLGCKAELADLHNVMRRLASLAQPIQRSTSRALNSHQTREHESSTDCLTK